MSGEDLLVLEVPLSPHERSPHEPVSGQEVNFYFGPLEALGLPLYLDRMTFTTAQGVSSIPNTTTCVVVYNEGEFRGISYNQIQLAHIHLYEEHAFRGMLEDVGFEILDSTVGGRNQGFLVCVVRSKD